MGPFNLFGGNTPTPTTPVLNPTNGSTATASAQSTPWWQSLLLATGQTFVNGLANTLNVQNQQNQNPYTMGAAAPVSNLAMYGLVAFVLFKILK